MRVSTTFPEEYPPSHSYKSPLTLLARSIVVEPGVPTACTDEMAATSASIDAHFAEVGVLSNTRVWDVVVIPWATLAGASQLCFAVPFLKIQGPVQYKVQRASTMRGGSWADGNPMCSTTVIQSTVYADPIIGRIVRVYTEHVASRPRVV